MYIKLEGYNGLKPLLKKKKKKKSIEYYLRVSVIYPKKR